jgi:hypothetical protein
VTGKISASRSASGNTVKINTNAGISDTPKRFLGELSGPESARYNGPIYYGTAKGIVTMTKR